jgi:hydroxyethylthiazole kinase-like uncharacterized protein yjeF
LSNLQDDIAATSLLDKELKPPVSVREMQHIEDSGEILGITKLMMMENAGSSIADFIFQNLSHFGQSNKSLKRVLFVAGTGNNGGDSFVSARHLAYWKGFCEVSIAIIGNPGEIRAGEAKINYEILQKIQGIKLITIESEIALNSFSDLLESADVIVVGMFGTGFRGEPRALQSRIIGLINANLRATKISVDVPSGLEADSGNFKKAVQSDFTITMHAPKIGMLRDQNTQELCGRILVANIGIPL